jgi:hypothetical protein
MEVDETTNFWTKHVDEEGREYFSNESTGETQWEKPENFHEHSALSEELSEDGRDEAGSFSKSNWTKHLDDEGRDYYYNENTGETQWEKPEDFHEKSALSEEPPEDDYDDKVQSPSKGNWTHHLDDEGREYYYNENSGETQWERPDDFIDEETSPDRPVSRWTKHQDEDGREYFYNRETGETQWEQPDDFDEEQESTTKSSEKWQKHTDEEGREFFYNELTGETQWEKPDTYREDEEVGEETQPEAKTVDKVSVERKEIEPEPTIDPEVKRLQDAENALNEPDAIMEHDVLDNVAVLIDCLGGSEGGQKAMQSLVGSFHGQTAICGLTGLWLAELKSSDEDRAKSENSVRETVEDVVSRIAKERFTKAGGDNIFQLQKSEAGFLEDMIDSGLWRKLLIDLSATHRDSTLLSYCLSSISKRGHHREIAKRINQSDHFPVYSAMLASELSIVGSGSEAKGMRDLLEDLRRTCTSTSYTYLYALEVLRNLVHTAEEEASRDATLLPAIRKWTRLREELESSMVDPTVESRAAGASSLYRKRRRDIALCVSELIQRQRRRLRPDTEEADEIIRDEQRDVLERALADLLLAHSETKKLDDRLLDQLLSQGTNGKAAGRLINCHPLALKCLLGHLFLPGNARAPSLLTRTKCAKLVALAVLAAESSTKKERGFEDPSSRQAKEEQIKNALISGSQLLELVENMVSFTVTDSVETKDSNPSAGVKLSILANKSAPVAEGVVIWAKQLVAGSEFVSSASYPTLSPSILSLLRILSMRHPFTRPTILEVASLFLDHSNSELSYQKMTELKEQALRLLLLLMIQGEVVSVLGSIANRLNESNSKASMIDASLIRYFVGGLLDVVQSPCSSLMIGAIGSLLLTSNCVDALNSTYFGEDSRGKLNELVQSFKLSLESCKGEGRKTTIMLIKTYG